MSNPPFDPKMTKPGSAGWYEPDGTYHPFNVDREPDAEFAVRVKDLGGAGALAALAGAIASASSTDQVRAAKSSIDALLYEMQHPKQVIYEAPADVAIPNAYTQASPVIDTAPYRWVGWYLSNTGANALTTYWMLWGEAANMAVPFQANNNAALAVGAGNCAYSQAGTAVAVGSWMPLYSTPLVARYVQLYCQSAAGTTIRTKFVGMR